MERVHIPPRPFGGKDGTRFFPLRFYQSLPPSFCKLAQKFSLTQQKQPFVPHMPLQSYQKDTFSATISNKKHIRTMMRSTFPTAHLFAFIFLAFGFINHTNAQNDQEPIRINVGGKRYRDNKGDIWSADEYYRNGKVFSDSRWIFDTNDGTLYRSSRYDNTRNTNSLSYSIPGKCYCGYCC